MTFLNPAILWGLLALAVPIIIHFFNLQRPKQVLFSNVAFVKEVKKSVVRRLRFKQWLLLLLRLLAITCLVLAFANPVILSDSTVNLRGNRSVAVVIDDSYSMTAGNEKGNYFQQAQSLSRSIINAYSKQDEFLVMNTSDIQLNASFGEQAEALEAMKGLQLRQNIHAHSELLNFDQEIFASASNQLRELYLISDFQTSTVMADSQTIRLEDSSILIKYIPLATREQKNVYVADHQIISQIIEKGKPVQLRMTLVNDGNSPVKDLGVRVLLDGKVVSIANKSLDPNTTEELDLSFTPSKSGWLSGHIELDDYPIEFDNRRYFSIYVPESEKVLIVESQLSNNLKILYRDLFEQFEPTFVPDRNISSQNLNDYRSLVLVGFTQLSTGLAAKLRSFLNEGGSVMFFPGDGMQLENINQFWSSMNLGTFSPPVSIQSGIKASLVELEHPIFDGIFTNDRKNRDFDAPNVFRYFPFELSSGSVQNVIMRMENQSPFLIESRVGEGLLYTFTSFPGDAWTDFHVKTSFAPVIFRANQIMNQTQNVQSGQEIGFFTPKSIRTSNQDLIKLSGEDGLELIPEQYVQGGATILNFDKLELNEGNYSIVQGDSLLEKIAFNISDLESRLGFTSEDQLRETLDKAGYQQIEVLPAKADDISDQIKVEKEGIPLWKYFVLFVLLFLLAEIMVLRLSTKS